MGWVNKRDLFSYFFITSPHSNKIESEEASAEMET